MTSTIKIKNSSTAGAVPGSGDLVQGELAVNVTDKKIYTKNASGTIVNLGTTPSITDNGNAEAIVIDSSENIGIGVTPSAWTTYKAVQVGSFAAFADSTSGNIDLSSNRYNASGDKYIGSGYATMLRQSDGAFKFFTAASGTAGNSISFTQAMTLDASGNLLVGTTSAYSTFTVKANASANGVAILGRTSDNVGVLNFLNSSGTTAAAIYNSPTSLVIDVNSAERMRIDSSGNLLVGDTTNTFSSKAVIKGGGNTLLAWQTGTGASLICRLDNTSGRLTTYNYNGSDIGTVTTNGTTTSYNTSSDYRLKEITGGLTGYKERLFALQPKQGSWKVDGSEFRGFLAHEFAESYPASVNGEKDAVDADGKPQYQGMQAGSSEVIADLVAYIKELETRLSELEQA